MKNDPEPSEPDELITFSMPSPDGSSYILIGDREPGQYENHLRQHQPVSDVAWLAMKLTSGSGTLIDVGANIGTVTFPVAMTGTHVLSVEMLPDNCQKLHLGCIANGLSNVRVFQGAASNKNGIVRYGNTQAWGRIGAGVSEAASYRLDLLIHLYSLADPNFPHHPLVLKLDVEFHEAEVLEGASALIDDHRPLIIFEAIEIEGTDCDASRRAKHYLASRNYDLFLQRGCTLIPREANEPQEGHVADWLAVPREKHQTLESLDIRDLSAQDSILWITEMASDGPNHRLHTVGVIEQLLLHSRTEYAALEIVLSKLAEDEDHRVAVRADLGYRLLVTQAQQVKQLTNQYSEAPRKAWWRRLRR
jgi:FkbM family methyltransferase